MKYHRLLNDVSTQLYIYIKDIDVCKEIGIRYLKLRENESLENARKYHHDCLKDKANNIPNDQIPWSYYIPFNQLNNDIVGYEILCAHLNKKDNIKIYLKILASDRGIRILGDVVCGAIGIEYFKKDLSLRDKIKEINDMKYHILISCYNNLVID